VRDRQPPASSIAVIIPVYDEAEAIGTVVAAIPRSVVSEIVVVDGGSRDNTVEIAQQAGARVVVETRRGYGRACATGVAATSCDVLVFLDGDGSDGATELGRVVAPLLDGEAQLVLGARAVMSRDAMPAFARLGNSVAAALISLLWRQRITDLPSFKAIRRRDLVLLGMTEATYGWTVEMIVKVARQRLRIVEMPLPYHHRIGGVSKVSGNPRASLLAAVAILRVLARHALGRCEAGVAGRVALVD
jgi:glycosyltransferase involved in cell wall biosynthesis